MKASSPPRSSSYFHRQKSRTLTRLPVRASLSQRVLSRPAVAPVHRGGDRTCKQLVYSEAVKNKRYVLKSVVYLGHVTSAQRDISRGKTVSKAILHLATLTCIKDVRSVKGVMNFVRRFVPNFTEVTAPHLTRKGFTTRPRFQETFRGGSAR